MVKIKQVTEMVMKRDLAKEIFWLGLVSLLLSVSISVLPKIGIFLSSFTPIPLIIIFYFWGINYGLIVCGIIFTAITFLSGIHIGILFILQYGVMAFILGESFRLNYSVKKTFFIATTVPLVVIFIFISMFLSGTDLSLISLMEKVINSNIDNTINIYKEMGVNDQQIELIQGDIKKLTHALLSALPSLVIIGSFFSISINYFLARFIMVKRYGIIFPEIKSIGNLIVSDSYVWFLIVGGISLLIDIQPLNVVGINLVILMLFIYCIQGFGVISQFSEKWKTPNIVKSFVYLIIFSQPFSLILITFIGLFDIWLDFRKLRIKEDKSINQ